MLQYNLIVGKEEGVNRILMLQPRMTVLFYCYLRAEEKEKNLIINFNNFLLINFGNFDGFY